MGYEDIRKQCDFERGVSEGDRCIAFWTNSGYYYRTEVQVDKVNEKSFRVSIQKALDGYPVGWMINVPNFLNTKRWSWFNRLAPSVV